MHRILLTWMSLIAALTISGQTYTPSQYVFTFPNGEPAQIGGCVTIDNSTDDNGALACMRKAWPNPMANGTTAEAITNLLSCGTMIAGTNAALKLDMYVIDGHGTDGVITTGNGQTLSNPNKYVALWNRSYWAPEFQRLANHGTILTLLSCHTGAGEDGADLLYDLATIVNRPVRARTGFTYCGGNGVISFENGSTWQVAMPPPAPRPIPIPAPTPHFVAMMATRRAAADAFSMDAVVSVDVFGGQPRKADRVEPQATRVENARDFLRLVQFDSPFDPGGEPLALITARIRIGLRGANGVEVREYLVYNDRLVRAATGQRLFYAVRPGFAEALRTLRR